MKRNLLLRSTKMLFVLMIVFVMTAYSVVSTQGAAAQGSAGPTIPGNLVAQTAQIAKLGTNQIIIQYKSMSDAFVHPSGGSLVGRLSQASGVSLQYVRPMSGDAHVLRLPARMPIEQVRAITARLMALPDVAYAEPDQIMFRTLDPAGQPARPLALAPNDPSYAAQWDMKGVWGINAPTAWNTTTGSSSVVVAVIDTGITSHTEFAGRTVPGYDFIGDVLVANDGNGRDSDPSDPGDWITAAEANGSVDGGWFAGCYVDNSSWHGTHTAGTIGATGNNGTGIAGVNWASKIEPVRVLGKCGGYDSDVIDGMRWAAGLSVAGVPANAHPAKVLSISLGGSGACTSAMQSAINQIKVKGAVVVVAAGNEASDASGFNPGNCANVITVGATGPTGDLTYYSNYGASVEISAPGGEMFAANDPHGILSTLNTGLMGPVAPTYQYYQGTSMATPHLSGVVSLLYSIDPTLTPAQVLYILQHSVKAFPSGSTCNPTLCGSGIVNAGAALATTIITISGGTGVAGTVLHYTDGTAKTAVADGTGHYTFNVSYNFSGTVTVSEPHHTFTPDHITYANLVTDQASQNYTGAQIWMVSGNTGAAGATLSYTDGTPKTTTSDGAGYYSFTVSDNWGGTLTPSKTGVSFTPTSLDYSGTPVTSDLTAQNFTSDQLVHSISGKVNAAGAILSFNDDGPLTVVADSSGNYSLLVTDGFNDTITPTKTGVKFTPTMLNYALAPVTTDLTSQNFTASQSFMAVPAQDGWVLESTEVSGLGGSMNSAATSITVGDDASNRQYRGVLSFSTAALPDNAMIQSVQLKVKQYGAIVGTNPFTALLNLWVDIRHGAFGANALQLTDFNAAASVAKVGSFSKVPVSGWYTSIIKPTGYAQINKTGTTQFRLYFGKDDNNNHVADYIRFISGNYTSNHPLLVISYTLP